MILSMIAAIGKNNELGKGNQLLWNMPADMKHFRDLTTGHSIIMGRKTFESIGRPLPNRTNVVLSRKEEAWEAPGCDNFHSLEEALQVLSLEQGRKFEENQDEVELFIIGGGQIYREGITKANRLYITHIDGTFDADIFFPTIGPEWREIARENHAKDEKNPYDYSFVTYERR